MSQGLLMARAYSDRRDEKKRLGRIATPKLIWTLSDSGYARLNLPFIRRSIVLKHPKPVKPVTKSMERDTCRCGCGCKRKVVLVKGMYGERFQLAFCQPCAETHQKTGKYRSVPLQGPNSQAKSKH